MIEISNIKKKLIKHYNLLWVKNYWKWYLSGTQISSLSYFPTQNHPFQWRNQEWKSGEKEDRQGYFMVEYHYFYILWQWLQYQYRCNFKKVKRTHIWENKRFFYNCGKVRLQLSIAYLRFYFWFLALMMCGNSK